MVQFEQSRWADNDFSQNYRDEAEMYLPLRRQFLAMAKSFYGHFIAAPDGAARILDLGCGDGRFIEELCQSFSPAEATLVDGSPAMLEAARNRLGKKSNINFIQASFQELLNHDPVNNSFDFVYSSLAVHHLTHADKKRLYAYIYNHLAPGGWFVHYDVVLPCSDKLEKWYLSLWRQWISEHQAGEKREKMLRIPDQYKVNPDNAPDTLETQMATLEEIGFHDVDCYYQVTFNFS